MWSIYPLKLELMNRFGQYDIRAAGPDEAAALFVVHAAITPIDAGRMFDWMQEMEDRLETGGRAWVVARGRRLAGYAVVDPLPGLPGVFDLTGGMIPTHRRQGLGSRLLRHAQTAAREMGIGQMSCRVESLEDEMAQFLLQRDFYVEHEECLLELRELAALPPILLEPPSELVTYPREQAEREFCRVYDDSFAGMPWSQPYTPEEVATMLARPEDLLFAVVDGAPVGVVWQEVGADGRGRVEPLGIIRPFQGRGHGRRLLLAALHELRNRGAGLVEIGVWRDNVAAFNLYRSLGFIETDSWHFLACNLHGVNDG